MAILKLIALVLALTLNFPILESANAGIADTVQFEKGYRTVKNGWVFVHIEGDPLERGLQYGHLLVRELERAIADIKYMAYINTGKPWEFFVLAAEDVFAPHVPEEYLNEIKAIAEGARDSGLDTSWQEILALNAYEEIFDYWWPKKKRKYRYSHSPSAPEGHCSAFIATGDATSDGGIVIAHNDWSSYVIGQSYNIILDITPADGHRICMQTKPGHLDSNTDFFITGAGIVGTETTICGFTAYQEGGLPSFVRSRRAMQYSDSLDDLMKYLREGNNGGNASSWLLGNIHTGEIVRFELGFRFGGISRNKNGYFIGFNAPEDPRIRNLECCDTGYDDIRRHTGARRVRLTQLMEEHKGKIDVELAKTILADHYDVYLEKPDHPCSRTVDGHYELDDRAFMSDPYRPKAYSPHGTLDGKVTDSTLAQKMSLWARWGNSAGMAFEAEKFLKKHIQYNYLQGHLRDRPTQPWTLF